MKRLSKTELDAPLPEKKVMGDPNDDDDECDPEAVFELIEKLEGSKMDEDDMD